MLGYSLKKKSLDLKKKKSLVDIPQKIICDYYSHPPPPKKKPTKMPILFLRCYTVCNKLFLLHIC